MAHLFRTALLFTLVLFAVPCNAMQAEEPGPCDGTLLYLQGWLLLEDDVDQIESAHSSPPDEESTSRAHRLLRRDSVQAGITMLIEASRCESAGFKLPSNERWDDYAITSPAYNIRTITRVLLIDADRLREAGEIDEAVARLTTILRIAEHTGRARGPGSTDASIDISIELAVAQAASSELLELAESEELSIAAMHEISQTLVRIRTEDPFYVLAGLRIMHQNAVNRTGEFTPDASHNLMQGLVDSRIAARAARELERVLEVCQESSNPIADLRVLGQEFTNSKDLMVGSYVKTTLAHLEARAMIMERLNAIEAIAADQ